MKHQKSDVEMGRFQIEEEQEYQEEQMEEHEDLQFGFNL